MSHLTPIIIEYRGNPKQYVSVVLDAINLGRLTYDGVANCEQTFRALASVVDVISPKNGKTLSVETLVSYEKKKRMLSTPGKLSKTQGKRLRLLKQS